MVSQGTFTLSNLKLPQRTPSFPAPRAKEALSRAAPGLGKMWCCRNLVELFPTQPLRGTGWSHPLSIDRLDFREEPPPSHSFLPPWNGHLNRHLLGGNTEMSPSSIKCFSFHDTVLTLRVTVTCSHPLLPPSLPQTSATILWSLAQSHQPSAF